MIIIVLFSHRRSKFFTFAPIESEPKEHSLSLMLYETIRWKIFSLRISHFHLAYFIQNLIELDLSYDQLGDEAVQGLADTLRNSKVNGFSFFFLYLYHFHIYLCTQTLTKLDLSNNLIVATGVKQLADALRNNTVQPSYFVYLSHLSRHFFTQTLVDLDLYGNEIGSEGAQYLADTLKENTVNICLFSSFACPYARFHIDTHQTQFIWQ